MSNVPSPKPRGRHRASPPCDDPSNVEPLELLIPTEQIPVVQTRRERLDFEREAATARKQQHKKATLATGSMFVLTAGAGVLGLHALSAPVRGEIMARPVVSPESDRQAEVPSGSVPLVFDTAKVGTVAAPPPPPPPPPAPVVVVTPEPPPPPPVNVVPAQGQPEPVAVAPPPPRPVEARAGLVWPLASVRVNSPFGWRDGVLHTGIDLFGACGTPVYSAGVGKVVEAGWSAWGGGNRVVVDHGLGVKTTYNHLNSISVGVGNTVSQGALVGGVGSTGNSTGCHLHFEVLVNDSAVNPATMLP